MLNFRPHFRAISALCLALTLCTALLLPACGGQSNSESRSIITAAPPAPQPDFSEEADASANAAPAEDEAVDLVTVATAVNGSFAQTTAGCYTLRDMGDGSCNLLFIDYETLILDTADTPQEDDSLRGRLVGGLSQLTPITAGGQLYIFRTGATAEDDTVVPAAITQYDADGTPTNQLVLPEQHTFQPDSALLWDGAAFLVMLLDLTGDTPVHTLYRANFDTLELTELQRFETGFDYSLEGQWDKGPVVLEAVSLPPSNDPAYSEAFENRDYHLYTLGLNSGRRETLMRWKQGLPYAMQGNTFFYWDDDADQLHALFANTGEDSVAAHGFAPDDHSFVSMQRAFYGGQIILQFSNTSGSRVTSVAVNPATGATFTPPLPSRSQNITIIAELGAVGWGEPATAMGGAFLVRSGEHWVSRSIVEPDYDAATAGGDYNSQFISMPEYVLISQENYWAGNVQLAPVEDLVYQ